ncbi:MULTISPECIES: helix-turn-helix domain-containing protein [unclassified Rhodococcus (in: high G+C Gram-positive bacteria)]|uniref:winged helix-turn-helix transcriptional regulator n=1 Tax=unclassified Rhodococcus (in: high G+C Gram-positive bacteria) TaxID=192944 RepID=UPI0024B81380|nr:MULTISPECIES: helix-turn-helix domain-containing protein [unclassified Rhodococcus (in: high G+C Gram-positive bacteria)]MDI9948893.1 helix-turn-helix domain-containing protein [Rhodococcus sp. IEGM 1305]MDI9978201.1 helix-turn-helix domain-containing protein [Rhodococcus sp. IEGM 1307]
MGADYESHRLSAVDRMMTRIRELLQQAPAVTDESEEIFGFVAALLVEFSWNRSAPVVGIVGHVGNYWRNWLLVILRVGPLRPSMIQRLLDTMDPSHPLSQKILTHNLRMLERDGLLSRTVVADARKHVVYDLTPLGRSLSDLVMNLIEWGYARSDQINCARAEYDASNHGGGAGEV